MTLSTFSLQPDSSSMTRRLLPEIKCPVHLLSPGSHLASTCLDVPVIVGKSCHCLLIIMLRRQVLLAIIANDASRMPVDEMDSDELAMFSGRAAFQTRLLSRRRGAAPSRPSSVCSTCSLPIASPTATMSGDGSRGRQGHTNASQSTR